MVSVKVEIVQPFIKGDKKGNIGYMKKEDAIKYEKEGLVKILDKKIKNPIKKQELKKEIKITPVKKYTNATQLILERNLEKGKFVNVFAYDDKKKEKKNYNEFYKLTKDNINYIIEQTEFYNIGSFGVFINLNPLTTDKRKKEFVANLNFIFIDLDHANEDDYKYVKTWLETKGFNITYTAQSGGGYHILLEIDLDNDKEIIVKNFLNYLHTQVSPKVDIATGDMTRLLRVPESEHNKKESFRLKTLDLKKANEKEISNNNELILDYQHTEQKDENNLNYLCSIKKDDIFFSTILNNTEKWQSYYELLNGAADRNGNFIKNLGAFISNNKDYEKQAKFFLNNWESSRVGALDGWKNKVNEVNYYELLKWSKNNDIKEFIELLKKQIKNEFLDEYETYYLEEEMKDKNCILYFPKKNYFVQKSINDVLLNIYFDCLEKSIDLEQELKMDYLFEKWHEFGYTKKRNLILNQLLSKLEKEKRLKKIFNINYAPNNAKFLEYDNKKYFNIYKKAQLLEETNETPQEFDFRHIKELILNLCGNNEEYYNWFVMWLANIIQNPMEKMPTAVIFQGQQGTGKGVLKNHILDPIFGFNCQEINQTHLESSFNEYLLGKQIIIANEVMHNENRQTLPNILKNLVTDEHITIQRKFRTDLVIRNYSHWIFTTNSDNPIKIEEDDRRYSVFRSTKLKGGGRAAQKFVKALIENKEHEIPAFITYLKNLNVDTFYVSIPLETEAKEEIKELNKDSVEKFREYLQQFNNLYEANITLFGNDKNYFIKNDFGDGAEYLVSDNFYLLYEKYCETTKERGIFAKQNFNKRLSNKGCKTIPKWIDKRTLRVFDVKDIENYIYEK